MAFETVLRIVHEEAYRAIPRLIDSSRAGSDRQVTNPRTRKLCENNPNEIGYLLKSISENERESLKNFTVNDLSLTHEKSGISDLVKYSEYNKKGNRGGRWKL